jgi:hypothetical protein
MYPVLRFYLAALCVLLCTFVPQYLQAQCPATVNAGEDILLCAPPTPTQLNGEIDGPFLNFAWIPTTGLTGANTLTPTVNVPQNTTYVLRVRAVNTALNLIANGDFEGGAGSFTSDYTFSPGNLWPGGTYEVLDNPQNTHPNFAPCGDHTSGNGQMLAVNGNGTANQNVWCQTVSVEANTEYTFTAWATSLVAAAPAILQFSVNGTNIGTTFGISPQLCNWQQFNATWNSGGNTSATICVVNQNTALSGNDFALDDIGFSPICVVTDTVKVQIASVVAVATPSISIIPCEDADITLNGNGSSTGSNYTYQWDTPDGNIVSGGNSLSPVIDAPGEYSLIVTYTAGAVECTKTATVNVIESPNPLVTWITPPQPLGCSGNNVLLIGNSSQANVTYAWSTTNGNIVSGQFAKNCLVNQPGTYTLQITHNLTGCTATTEVTVTTANNPPLAVANTNQSITCLQNTAILSGAGSSTGAGITYNWQALPGGATLASPVNAIQATATAPGTFVLAVTNTSNGCISYDTVTVGSNLQVPLISIVPPDSLNCTQDTVVLQANTTPANSSYIWSTIGGQIAGSSNNALLSVTAAGTYNVVATNPANGCTATTNITVIADRLAPIAIALPADSLSCQQSSVTLSGAGSSVGNRIRYQWQGPNIVSGAQSLSPVVNAPGTYTLLVSNTQNACTAIATTTVVADVNTITAVANAPDTLDCLTTAVQLNASGSTPGAGFLYTWSTSNGQVIQNPNTATPTVTAPGIYTLLLTNPANGCSSTAFANVQLDTIKPNFSIINNVPITCATPVVTLLTQNNGPNGQYGFNWNTLDGQIVGPVTTTPSISANQPGTYTVVISNAKNGCTAVQTTLASAADQIPILSIPAPEILNCTRLSTALQVNVSGVSGAVQTNWSTSAGQFVSGQNTPVPIVNQAGTYNVLVTNSANGCTSVASINVQQDTAKPALILPAVSALNCTDTTRLLSAIVPGSGMNLSWSSSDGQFVSATNGTQVVVNRAGTYSVLVSNPQNGCSSTAALLVLADQTRPSLQIAPPGLLSCVQNSSTLSAAITQAGSNYSIAWSSNGGSFLGAMNTATTTVNAPGTYTVLVTNDGNTCTRTATTTVFQNTQPPIVQLSAQGNLTCVQTNLPIQGSIQGFSASIPGVWSTPDGHFFSGQNTLTPLIDEPGTYVLMATDPANGCADTASIAVQQDIVPPTVSAGSDAVLLCSLSALMLNGSTSNEPGLLLNWTASPGNAGQGSTNTASLQVVLPGTFVLTAINPANGCTAQDTAIVSADVNAPVVGIDAPALLTCAQNSIQLNGTASGSNPTLVPQWLTSNGGVLQMPANTLSSTAISPGTYTLVVTDTSNGCSSSANVQVSQNITPPQVEAGTALSLTCVVNALNLSGSSNLNNAVQYNWSSSNGSIQAGANSLNPLINAPGVYVLQVTNLQNGCTNRDSVTVGEDRVPPVLSAAPSGVLTCTQATLQLAANSTIAAVLAKWSTSDGHFIGGETTLSPGIDEPGTYLLIATSTQNGCADTLSVVVAENTTAPSADAGSAAPLTCAIVTRTLSGTGMGSSEPANLVWKNGSLSIATGIGNLSANVQQPGTYQLIATDPTNGCTATDAVVLDIDTTAPLLSILPAALLTCTRTTVPLVANVLNASGSIQSNWSSAGGQFVSGQSTLTPMVNAPAIYQLNVTNLTNGCTATQAVTVDQNTNLPIVDAGVGGVLHCNQAQIVLQGTASAAGAAPLFLWSSSNGHLVGSPAQASVAADSTGTYTLVVTNLENGCTASDSTQLIEVAAPDFAPSIVQPNCIVAKGSLDFGPIEGGQGPFMYSFDGGNTFSGLAAQANLLPGTYELLVEDTYGCTDMATVELYAPVYPVAELPAILRIEQGDSIQLIPLTTPPAVVIKAWNWATSAPGSLSCTECPSPWASPLVNSTYTVTVSDPNGCTATARTTIQVDRRRHVYAPNVIAPGGAAPNHRFTIFGRGLVEIEHLQVFDRWGELVWEGRQLAPGDSAAGWDGNFGTQQLQPSVFIWQAILVFPDGTKEVYSGDVTVIR